MDKKKVFAVVAVAIVVIAAAGVAVFFMNGNNTKATVAEDKVNDSLGRTVNIPDEIDSIYCVGACSLRLVSYFDAVDKVRAIETTGTFNTRDDQTYYLINKGTFSSLPQVATDAESVLAFAPSIIITSAAADVATADDLQSKTGIPVYVINANLEFGESFYEQISSLGTLFGEKDRAAALNDGIADLIEGIKSSALVNSSLTAYASGMFYYGGASMLKASGNYLPFDYSNISNAIGAAENGQPYIITLETLIAADPDYFFIDSIGLSTSIASINDFVSDGTGLGNVSAIVNDRVYSTMIYKCYGTNWENQLINVYFVASKVNGGSYSWSFEEKANDIIHLFYPHTTMTYSDIVDSQTGSGCAKVTL
jgi:iron complex transport system substrate-binding protein